MQHEEICRLSTSYCVKRLDCLKVPAFCNDGNPSGHDSTASDSYSEEPTSASIQAPVHALPFITQPLSTPADEERMTRSQSLTVSNVLPPEDSHKDYEITDITESLRGSVHTPGLPNI